MDTVTLRAPGDDCLFAFGFGHGPVDRADSKERQSLQYKKIVSRALGPEAAWTPRVIHLLQPGMMVKATVGKRTSQNVLEGRLRMTLTRLSRRTSLPSLRFVGGLHGQFGVAQFHVESPELIATDNQPGRSMKLRYPSTVKPQADSSHGKGPPNADLKTDANFNCRVD
jgi:hypothetical protein